MGNPREKKDEKSLDETLEESRLLLDEMDAALKGSRLRLFGRAKPTLVRNPGDEDKKK